MLQSCGGGSSSDTEAFDDGEDNDGDGCVDGYCDQGAACASL
jgi:hypothetical protein